MPTRATTSPTMPTRKTSCGARWIGSGNTCPQRPERKQGSKKVALWRCFSRRREARAIQLQAARAQEAMAAAGDLEPPPQQFRERALAAHARAEIGVVILAAIHLAHAAHHVFGAL